MNIEERRQREQIVAEVEGIEERQLIMFNREDAEKLLMKGWRKTEQKR